ncbi:unnamed protein product [Ectocarpus sp. CCAP 1310/34]|nr:unnamed protein product [Ectocarpus sp. CCAP 1310/34]
MPPVAQQAATHEQGMTRCKSCGEQFARKPGALGELARTVLPGRLIHHTEPSNNYTAEMAQTPRLPNSTGAKAATSQASAACSSMPYCAAIHAAFNEREGRKELKQS